MGERGDEKGEEELVCLLVVVVVVVGGRRELIGGQRFFFRSLLLGHSERRLILACQDRQGTPHVSESAGAPVPSSTPKLIVWVRVLIVRWSRLVTRAGRQARCLTRLRFSWRCY